MGLNFKFFGHPNKYPGILKRKSKVERETDRQKRQQNISYGWFGELEFVGNRKVVGVEIEHQKYKKMDKVGHQVPVIAV